MVDKIALESARNKSLDYSTGSFQIYKDLMEFDDQLQKLTMWELAQNTSSIFHIAACRAGSIDCSKHWKNKFFENGRCKVYIGKAHRQLDIGLT